MDRSMPRRGFVLAVCAAGVSATTACQGPEVNDVSLIALIANPTAFDGKRVRVIGFLHLEFEGDHLYVSKADSDAAISKNAVWITPPAHIPTEGLSDQYVLVEGTFDARMTGHLGMNSGSIREVGRLQRWRSRAEYEAEAKGSN